MKNVKDVCWMLALAATIMVTVSSCNKMDDEETYTNDVVYSNSLSENLFSDVENVANQAEAQSALTKSFTANGEDTGEILGSCVVITHDRTTNPRVLTVDFGTENCLGKDGRTRRGKIIITYTGAYRDSGSVKTAVFDNYFVNDYQLIGTKTVTNKGLNEQGNPYFTIAIDGSIISPEGNVVLFSSERVREWTAGYETRVWFDDVYAITGSSTLTTAAGLTYTSTITAQLEVIPGHRYFTSGTIEITGPEGEKTVVTYEGTNKVRVVNRNTTKYIYLKF